MFFVISSLAVATRVIIDPYKNINYNEPNAYVLDEAEQCFCWCE